MKRFVTWILTPLLCLTVGLFPSIQAGAQPGHFAPDLTAQALIAEVNALRASNDLPPFQANPILMRTAQTHADYISGAGVMTQFGADGKRPYQRALDAGYAVAGDISLGGTFAELIHSGTNLTPAAVVTIWKNAPNQLKLMLSSEFKDVGAGMAVVNGAAYYVLDAGAQSDPAVTSTPEIPGLFVISTAGARGTPEVSLIVSAPQPNGEVFHVIQKNEALWSIAVAYGVTVDELKLLNRLATDEIFEGQTLLVRAAHTETPPPTETPTVTATLGIPTSTATLPPSPTATATTTPVPVAPASLRSGGVVVGAIVLVALLAAGIGSLLGRKKAEKAAE